MDILKQLKSLAEQVEVVNLRSEATTVEFEANKLKTSMVEETRGIAVRVVRDGKLGFAASSDESALNKLSANVLESASYGDPVPLQFPLSQPAPSVITYDRTITELSIPQLVDMGHEILNLILEVEPDVQINISLERGEDHITMRNHSGAEAIVRRSPLSIVVVVERIEGDDILMMFDMSGTTVWQEDYLDIARRTSEKLKLARRLTTVKSGQMPVLFSPSGALVLGLPLMEGINGKNVYTGVSPLAGKVGEDLFDEKISLVDDATLDGSFGSAPFDDEAVPHRRNVVIENGKLNIFLYDLKTAAQAGVESTGNGSRSLFDPPQPSPTNLVLENGDTPLKDMVSGIENGLLVEEVLGLGQGNIISGEFSNPLSLAFKIEKGEIVGRVKNASIAGNVYELLKGVAAVSQESQWVFNRFNLPYILLPEMNVVAKA
jgi:PmbA protein